MTDIREAVARAICETEGNDPNQKCGDNLMWQTYLKSTDAAMAAHIDAIMVPSEVALEVGANSLYHSVGVCGKGQDAAKECWHDILTAMRNEK